VLLAPVFLDFILSKYIFVFNKFKFKENIVKKPWRKHTPTSPTFPTVKCKKTTSTKHKNWDFTLSDTTAAKSTVINVSCLDSHHPWSQRCIIKGIGLQRRTTFFLDKAKNIYQMGQIGLYCFWNNYKNTLFLLSSVFKYLYW